MVENLHVAVDENGHRVFVVEAFARIYGPRAATWLGPNNERLLRDGDLLRGVTSRRAYRLRNNEHCELRLDVHAPSAACR